LSKYEGISGNKTFEFVEPATYNEQQMEIDGIHFYMQGGFFWKNGYASQTG